MTDVTQTPREQIDAALEKCAKPEPFLLTMLGGIEVFIPHMTTLDVEQWWSAVYPGGGKVAMTESKKQVELFSRLCCDAAGARLYPAKPDVEKLRIQPGGGKALAEFYMAACKQNFLYASGLEEALNRELFFMRKQVEKLSGENAALSSQLADALQKVAEKPTGESS